MTSVIQGQPITLTAQFFQYADGPAVDVTSLTIEITAPDATVIIGPTSTGIEHPTTGVYRYTWTTTATQALGDYVVVWQATETTTTSELIAVIAKPVSHTWPPSLADLKTDLGILVDTDDTTLSADLSAAISYVQRVRPTFNYDNDPLSCNPVPTNDIWSGTLRLAGRWFTRRRSPDGLVSMADLGVGRVPSVDPDIERMLGIGRYAEGAFA